ncbi:phosphotransferase family protein, partial [Pseudonocardia pini]|uniref:phosphotransferase family protein n=1 Tax=Pseudonocardia pini TaxID=2758030 RepID=UPI0015F0FF90
MTAELAKQLAVALAEVLGTDVEVAGLHRLTGGASRETWSFTANGERLILRRDPPGTTDRPHGMVLEARAIAAAERAGVPVPHLVDHGADPAVVGAPYLVTRHVDGETIARRLLRDPQYADVRPRLAAELGRAVARVHAIPLAEVPGLEEREPLTHLRETYDALGEPLPSVEIALHWLERNRPDAVPEAVVHGDFRNGNMIISADGVQAVLDWEAVHRGDPREDLGWLCVKCWRFGEEPAVGGYGPLADLLDGYAEVAGTRPDPAAVRWWQVYGTARWAVGCRGMAERHLSGAVPSVELIAIGRRVCEQEHDLLLALGHPAGDPTVEPAPVSDLHGQPTAAQLLDAVAMYLREDVMPGFASMVGSEGLASAGRLSFNA